MSNVRAAIEAANEIFVANFNRHDAAGLAGLYTATGCIMPSNSDIVSGAENIQGFWQGIFGMGVKEATLDTIEVEDHGDTAIEMGRYTMKVNGGAVADQGKYLVVWKNDGGTWKLHRDMFNSSQPAA